MSFPKDMPEAMKVLLEMDLNVLGNCYFEKITNRKTKKITYRYVDASKLIGMHKNSIEGEYENETHNT